MAETITAVLVGVLSFRGHETFPDRQLNKDFVRNVSRTFKDKVEDISREQNQEGGEAERKKSKAQVLKFVVDVLFDGLHEEIKDFQAGVISPWAAKLVLKVINEMLGGYKKILKTESFTQSVELSAVIFAHFLADSSPARRFAYHGECQELIYNLLYGTLGIATPNYKNFLREDLAGGRLSLLGYCSSLEGLDQKVRDDISEHLVNELESMVLNDKIQIQRAEKSLMYFHTFLALADKGTVEEKVLPQIEFI